MKAHPAHLVGKGLSTGGIAILLLLLSLDVDSVLAIVKVSY